MSKPVHEVTMRPGGTATVSCDNCTIIVRAVTDEKWAQIKDDPFAVEHVTLNIDSNGEIVSGEGVL